MKKYAIEIKWAFIFTASLLLWMVLERLVGLHDRYIAHHASLTLLFALVAFVIYYLALNDKRKHYYNGRMTWKQGFISGCILTLGCAILSPLAQWIISTIITPHYFDNVISYAVEMEQMTREAAEAQFNLRNYIWQSAVFALVSGVITSAIVAIFTRGPKSAIA